MNRPIPDLIKLLRDRLIWNNRDEGDMDSEAMDEAATALESLLADKKRMDWLETQDCWIGICGGDYDINPIDSCGGVYMDKVRDVCDKNINRLT
jgi:hypothetical protein